MQFNKYTHTHTHTHLESTAMKRAMVRFRGAREKGAMAFVECLEVAQEDTIEGSL